MFQQLRKEGRHVYYIPGMTVRHFIPKERLTKTWIRERYYFQGVSKSFSRRGFWQKTVLFGEVMLKSIYVFFDRWMAGNEGRRLLNACRRRSIQGTMVTLFDKKVYGDNNG